MGLTGSAQTGPTRSREGMEQTLDKETSLWRRQPGKAELITGNGGGRDERAWTSEVTRVMRTCFVNIIFEIKVNSIC